MQSSIKKIGNSLGVILNKKLLQQSGIKTGSEITIEAKEGTIIIKPRIKKRRVNRDLSTWRKQMKKAITKGQKPEKSIWPDDMSKKADKKWK
jgi:antitoxin component of MazEF toxin-antitoxin module